MNIRGGSGNNTYDIFDTFPSSAPRIWLTTLYAGAGFDTVNVIGTTSALVVDPQGSDNSITIGGRAGDRGNLSRIRGDVTWRRPDAAGNFVDIIDRDLPRLRLRDGRPVLYRTNPLGGERTATIDYGGLSLDGLDLIAGNGGNRFVIAGTPAADPSVVGGGVNVTSGDGVDTVALLGTNGDLNINLGAGAAQQVNVGDATHPLERLNGKITVWLPGPWSPASTTRPRPTQQNVVDQYGSTGASLLRHEYRDERYVRKAKSSSARSRSSTSRHGRGQYTHVRSVRPPG